DHLVAGLRQRHDREEHDGFSTRNDADILRSDLDISRSRNIGRNGFAKFRKPGRGSVLRPAFIESAFAGLDDVRGSWKIWLPNLEVNDVFSLLFECSGFRQNLECGLRPDAGHSLD